MITLLKKESRIQGIYNLKYSQPLERWHAYDGDTYYCPIHCGDGFRIRVNDSFFTARMELDNHWYVVIHTDKFRLHPKQNYDVILLF
jgi:hypothetical protein